MATVNFSVPDEVKREFDEEFGEQNKSAVIAELMRRAVRDQRLQRRREDIFLDLNKGREKRASATGEEIRNARVAGRS